MSVILIYVAIVLAGDTVVVLVAGAVERWSQTASLVTFFALFAFVFYAGWKLAVHITERYLLKSN